MIDWDLILQLEPMTIAGALIGAALNDFLPDLVLVVFLLILLSKNKYLDMAVWFPGMLLYLTAYFVFSHHSPDGNQDAEQGTRHVQEGKRNGSTTAIWRKNGVGAKERC